MEWFKTFLWEWCLDGVWGEHALVNDLANGGPDCAKESEPSFKILINLVLVSDSVITILMCSCLTTLQC